MHARNQSLTASQERRLVEYIEESFLEIMRNYKKRDHPSTTLPTLHLYLHATRTLLSLILQIPPIAPQQAALRTALLLRFTSETLSAITHYPRPVLKESRAHGNGEQTGRESLRELLDWLDELDRGWHAVLSSQIWDPDSRKGVDVEVDEQNEVRSRNDSDEKSDLGESYSPDSLRSTSSITQTDRTRLRSLLLSGSDALEEWLEEGGPDRATASEAPAADGSTSETNGRMEIEDVNESDLESTLEQLGLEQAFDDLFSRTLTAMGELGGEVLSAGNELEMACVA